MDINVTNVTDFNPYNKLTEINDNIKFKTEQIKLIINNIILTIIYISIFILLIKKRNCFINILYLLNLFGGVIIYIFEINIFQIVGIFQNFFLLN